MRTIWSLWQDALAENRTQWFPSVPDAWLESATARDPSI